MSEREAERRTQADAKAAEELTLLDTQLPRRAADPASAYEMNPIDLAEILRGIRLGKQHSDLLIATIHSHDTGLGCEEPGDFLPALAHAAIDAGAGAFIGHGRAPPDADRDLQGPAHLLQPRELLLERHAGAAARRHSTKTTATLLARAFGDRRAGRRTPT